MSSITEWILSVVCAEDIEIFGKVGGDLPMCCRHSRVRPVFPPRSNTLFYDKLLASLVSVSVSFFARPLSWTITVLIAQRRFVSNVCGDIVNQHKN